MLAMQLRIKIWTLDLKFKIWKSELNVRFNVNNSIKPDIHASQNVWNVKLFLTKLIPLKYIRFEEMASELVSMYLFSCQYVLVYIQLSRYRTLNRTKSAWSTWVVTSSHWSSMDSQRLYSLSTLWLVFKLSSLRLTIN